MTIKAITGLKLTTLNAGTVTAETRPANRYGINKTVTATLLTADIHEVVTNSPLGSIALLTALTYGGSVKKDVLTLTCTTGGPTAVFTVASALQGGVTESYWWELLM